MDINMKTLSLCIIVKNGEKYIEQCIESVFQAVSEVIIVDTGSTDNTLACIQRFHPQIFHYEWDDNFADARNFSLQQATCDFILVLDADEVLYPEDLPKLIALLETTTADGISILFHNFTDEKSEEIFNTHIGLRLFKNGCFHYEGAIHEQLTFNQTEKKPFLEIYELRLKHYGYLKSNAGLKKHNRNIPILQTMLDKNPNDAFHLFNMGNEYMSLEDYTKALDYFEKADQHKDISMAYSPHLIYRRATCLHNMKRNEESLTVLADGLRCYPACTDMEYLRGIILKKMKRFTLALDSFNKCLSMGEPPPTLHFFNETSNFRPLIEMAEIYFLMDDYNKSLDCYMKAMRANGKKYHVIYEIGKVLNKILADRDRVAENLRNLYADHRFKANVMVTTDVLLNERMPEQARSEFEEYMNEDGNLDADIYFLRGRLLFCNKEYEKAFKSFAECIASDTLKGILPNARSRSFEYMTACCVLCRQLKDDFLSIARTVEEKTERIIYLAFIEAHGEPLEKESLSTIASVLSIVLSTNEYQVFEDVLSILNLVEGDEALLALAEVYYHNNYHDMAVKTILRSVKELNCINSTAVSILNKEFIL